MRYGQPVAVHLEVGGLAASLAIRTRPETMEDVDLLGWEDQHLERSGNSYALSNGGI